MIYSFITRFRRLLFRKMNVDKLGINSLTLSFKILHLSYSISNFSREIMSLSAYICVPFDQYSSSVEPYEEAEWRKPWLYRSSGSSFLVFSATKQ
jgi:hypothetical protein